MPRENSAIEHAGPPLSRGFTRDVLGQNTHPGLYLDKFHKVADQEAQKGELQKVVDLSGVRKNSNIDEALRRWTWMLESIGAESWDERTVGPMTLHLSRASSLENAGICMHPVYGFVYLPGTGIKGMARAFAQTYWRQTQKDSDAASVMIERVFGKSSGDDDSAAGSVVFLDAYPLSAPRLVVDIVNSHHGSYYGGQDSAGDWEDPVPVYFLALAPGEKFKFAVSGRTKSTSSGDIRMAKQWIQDALWYIGAGAKTSSGYGTMKPVGQEPTKLELADGLLAEHKLTLLTPGFFAGANQGRDDCELRPASLQGQLRWWWRTMHEGYLSKEEMLELEGLIFGNTDRAAAVRIDIIPDIPGRKKDAGSTWNGEFERNHEINGGRVKAYRYLAYGMNDGGRTSKTSRYYIEPGESWKVRLQANRYSVKRGGDGKDKDQELYSLDAEGLLRQVQAAMYLLCNYGGVGAKARKGFGSLSCERLPVSTIDQCESEAKKFRIENRINRGFDKGLVFGSSIHLAKRLDVKTEWTDPWYAINNIGRAYLGFAQKYKHNEKKAGLGLPRKIHGPRPSPFPSQNARTHRAPIELRDSQGHGRYSSPVHIHVHKDKDNGKFEVRVICFPARYLPNLDESSDFLNRLLEHMREQLESLRSSAGPKVRTRKPVERVKKNSEMPKGFPEKLWGKLDETKKSLASQIIGIKKSYKGQTSGYFDKYEKSKDKVEKEVIKESLLLIVQDKDKKWLADKLGLEQIKQDEKKHEASESKISKYDELSKKLKSADSKKAISKVVRQLPKLDNDDKGKLSEQIKQKCEKIGISGWEKKFPDVVKALK